jgi:hypothetical protein
MSLRAVEPLTHSAIVTNEHFLSHANLVSTLLRLLCQALFSAWSVEAPSENLLQRLENFDFYGEKSLPR